MTQQTQALRLADELEMWTQGEPAAAELRRLEAENEMFRVMHQSHADKLKAVGAINAQLLEALEEAADDIEAWGAYASGYFQTKHDLLGAVNKARAAIAAAKDSNAA